MSPAAQDSVKSTTEDLRGVLLRVAGATCVRVLERAAEWVANLRMRPTSLDGYLEAMLRFQEYERGQDALFSEGATVDDMYDLFKVRRPFVLGGCVARR